MSEATQMLFGPVTLEPIPGLPNHHAIVESGYCVGMIRAVGPFQRQFSTVFNGRTFRELNEMAIDLLPPYIEPADWLTWCREQEAVTA